MTLTQANGQNIPLLSTTDHNSVPEGDLLTLAYTRSQPEHADFMSKHEGFDQDIKILLSTFIFHAAPEPVISLYDFIMTTFVPEKSVNPPQMPSTVQKGEPVSGTHEESEQALTRSSKIRVVVNLASVQGTLHCVAGFLCLISPPQCFW
jgi:vacuolar protein sorting-associated protein 13A/C